MSRVDLPPHSLKLVLLEPQIAPNTGNVGRLCAAAGAELHLVRPLGFVLSDRRLKRSAMDYWSQVKLILHDDRAALFAAIGPARPWLLTSKATRSVWTADFADGDWLILGNETTGIDDALLARFPDRQLRIPQAPGRRCLNLSTAAGIALYEALRRITL